MLLATDSKAGVRGDCLHRLKAASQSDAFSAVNDHCHTSWRRVFLRTTLRWTRKDSSTSVAYHKRPGARAHTECYGLISNSVSKHLYREPWRKLIAKQFTEKQ